MYGFAAKAFFYYWLVYGPADVVLFSKLKNKIENPCFLFPPILIFILIMDQKNKSNKNSALIPQ